MQADALSQTFAALADPAPLEAVAAWTDAYRSHWDASFDRLGV